MPQPPRGRGRNDRGGRRDPAGSGRGERTGPRTGTPRQPVGLERATRTPGAPPRQAATPAAAPPRPELPDDVEVSLPRTVRRELRRTVGRPGDADEALTCLAVGTERLEERDGEGALPFLRWAKHLAPRSGAVREALGAALYLAEEYADALAELQTYRRFTGRPDQNHLIADCHRALGRGTEKVAELIQEMQEADDIPLDRRIEGRIVWASTLGDAGDVGAGRAVLRPLLDELASDDEPTEAHLRLWYVAGDLAERAGDRTDARRWFERVDAVAEDFFDVESRLGRL